MALNCLVWPGMLAQNHILAKRREFFKRPWLLIFKQTAHCLNYGIFLPNGETEQKQVYNLALVFHMAECDK